MRRQKDKTPVAAGLLVHERGLTEVPSASSLRAFNHLSANMFMYHNMLSRAIERGSTIFDFGRSSEGSGISSSKNNGDPSLHPANWQYYVRKVLQTTCEPTRMGRSGLSKYGRNCLFR